MPTYDYRCKDCGHEFELFQSMKDRPKRKCPECGKPKLERLIGTGAGIIFKGSGFYETDYRSADYKKKAEAEKKGESGGDDTGEKKGKTSGDNGKTSDGESGGAKKEASAATGSSSGRSGGCGPGCGCAG